MTKKLQLEELHRVDLESYKSQAKRPVFLVLDNVRSALNVGSAFRTCDAFAIRHLYLVGITPVPPHTDITKSAIGATLSVDYSYASSIVDCLQAIRADGYTCVGLEQTTSSKSLINFKWPEKVAIVVGNEVEGISTEALPYLDQFVEIPQFGTKHSLNVSVATGMVLWDYMKQQLS